MERAVWVKLIKWKKKKSRKPLLIRGARQVGKTWLMKEFARCEYEQSIYVNFEENKRLKSLFAEDMDIERIISALQIESGLMVDPVNTLIIFDEVQEAKGALTSLKYFYERAPQYQIIAAGSMLGVALHNHTSFPVGKVEFLDLYPMNFVEFLNAKKEKRLVSLLESKDWELIKIFKTKYIQLLRQYYYIGGMPEVVNSFITGMNYAEVREIQKQILLAYEQDFSKHAPNEIVPRIRMLWQSIPAQLAKENKKFVYGMIKEGARARAYELAMSWLIDSGLIYKINRINKPAIPFTAYEEFSVFKLFMVDVGLLAAMADLDVKTLLDGNMVFEEFKGALSEQYVLQQLLALGNLNIYYWSAPKSTAEIDFLVQYDGYRIPVEVKAEENLQAKSLRLFTQKYKPDLAVRTSMSDYRKEDWLINLPLYAISELTNLLKINK